jgi:multicomponent Na+:H+ antiporter subunit E
MMATQGRKKRDRKGFPVNAEEGIISTDPTPGGRLSAGPFILTFIIMFGVWILLSGRFDVFHLTLGLISCALVAYLSSDLLFPSSRTKGLLRQWVIFARYIPWLMLEIVKANIHLTYLVFHPRMMDLIDPRIVKFRSRLKGDMAMVAFANSITLTPGTITVYVSIDGDFKVHAIDESSADALPGEMEVRLAMTFGDA